MSQTKLSSQTSGHKSRVLNKCCQWLLKLQSNTEHPQRAHFLTLGSFFLLTGKGQSGRQTQSFGASFRRGSQWWGLVSWGRGAEKESRPGQPSSTALLAQGFQIPSSPPFFCPSVSVRGPHPWRTWDLSTFTSRIPLFPKINTRSPGEPRSVLESGRQGGAVGGPRSPYHKCQIAEGSPIWWRAAGLPRVFRRRRLRVPGTHPSLAAVQGARGLSCSMCPGLRQGRRGPQAGEQTPGAGRCREQGRQVKARMRFRGCGLRVASQSRGPAGSPPPGASVRFRRRGLPTPAWAVASVPRPGAREIRKGGVKIFNYLKL